MIQHRCFLSLPRCLPSCPAAWLHIRREWPSVVGGIVIGNGLGALALPFLIVVGDLGVVHVEEEDLEGKKTNKHLRMRRERQTHLKSFDTFSRLVKETTVQSQIQLAVFVCQHKQFR